MPAAHSSACAVSSPDPERAEPYATRDRGKLWTRIHRRFVRVDAEVEVALLTSLVERSEGAGIAAFDELRALGAKAPWNGTWDAIPTAGCSPDLELRGESVLDAICRRLKRF